MIELLVVMSIISLLAAILVPVLGKARRQARTVIGMTNKRQIASAVQFYAMDSDGMYPESVATIGIVPVWHWQPPTMLTGFQKRSPKVHRSMSGYLHSYIEDASILFCPNAPKEYKYLQQSWDAGDDWTLPGTDHLPDPVFGTYCFYWNYVGYVDGRRPFKGPTNPGGGPGQSSVLVTDYFGYDHWRSPSGYGSCEKFRGAGIAKGTDASSDYWSREGNGEPVELDSFAIELSACYTDGHVGRHSPSDVVPLKVSLEQDGSIPYPDGMLGDFYIPIDALE